MKNKSFDKAYAELRNIVDELQDEEISIDKLSLQLKKATELVQLCKSRLREVEDEIKNISIDQN